MKVMLCKPRRGMGRYELLDADDTGGLEFATYFSKFTPNQSRLVLQEPEETDARGAVPQLALRLPGTAG